MGRAEVPLRILQQIHHGNVPDDSSKSSEIEAIYGSDLNASDVFIQNSHDRGVLDELSRCFNLGKVLNVRSPLHHSTTSRKVIIEVAKGSYFIKQKAPYASDDNSLRLSGEFQNFLAGYLKDIIPAVISCNDGRLFVEHGTSVYVAMPEVAAQAYIGHPGQVYNAGCALAQIHNLSAAFIDQNNELVPEYRSSLGEAKGFINLAAEVSRRGSRDPHRKAGLDFLGTVVVDYGKSYDELVERIIAHGDYAPSNLLFKGDEVAAILDFDNVAYHARIRDLGEAVMTFCGGMNYLGATSSLRTPISTSINFDQARLFLEGYRDNLKIPLNEAEIAHLHNEVVLAWVEHMGLGVVRGDFGFSSLLEAKSFPENTKVINNLLV